MAIVIPSHVVPINKSAIKAIDKYGASAKIKRVTLVDTPSTEVVDIEYDKYRDFYSQEKNREPVIVDAGVYDVFVIAQYNPSMEILNGHGWDEKCDVVLTVSTKKLIDVGLINQTTDDIKDFIEKIRVEMLIELDGRDYTMTSITPSSIYSGYPILLILICNIYKG